MPVMITLNKIYLLSRCETSLRDSRWKKIREAHKYLDLDTPFPLSSVLDSNGLADVLRCFQALPEHIEIPKRFALWCARQVQCLMAKRSVNTTNVAERYLNGDATLEELKEVTIPIITPDADANASIDAANAARSTTNVATSRQKQIDKLREMLNESDSQ
jgi:hypothetical protein